MRFRVAMVIDPWLQPFNGTVVSTRRFASALEAAGCQLSLLAVGDKNAASNSEGLVLTCFERMSVPGFNRIMNAMRVPLGKPDRALIRRALRDQDLLHIQFPFFLGHAALDEARKLGLPVVCSFHVQPENILINIGLSGSWFRALLYRLFVSAFYNRADMVIAPSEFAAKRLRENGVVRPITVISNGIPDAFFAISRTRQRSTPRPFSLLSVGRLSREKHHETLIEAVSLCRHKDDITLTLAGSGPQEAQLKALAGSLRVDARIGPVSDQALMIHYAGADVFVHCGAVELEGMSVLEAMAAGAAVLVSDAPECASAQLVDVVEARFNLGDVGGLAQKIDAWLADPEAVAARGKANRDFASSFLHRYSVDKLLGVYSEVVAGSGLDQARRSGGSAAGA